jgi:hypothetical protein
MSYVVSHVLCPGSADATDRVPTEAVDAANAKDRGVAGVPTAPTASPTGPSLAPSNKPFGAENLFGNLNWRFQEGFGKF